jgi:hypothetical protein
LGNRGGVENANAFAKGVHSGIHRRLSNITGAKAKLILVDEKGGTDGDGSYYIDSRQAVHSLREAFRIKYCPEKSMRHAGRVAHSLSCDRTTP